MITNKQRTVLVAVAVLVLAVAGPILADILQAHQAQAQPNMMRQSNRFFNNRMYHGHPWWWWNMHNWRGWFWGPHPRGGGGGGGYGGGGSGY